MKIDVRFPAGPQATVDDVIAGVTAEPEGGRLVPGDPRVVDFLTALARRLLAPSIARRHPELGSLGFFLRKTEIRKTLEHLRREGDDALVFPRGLVFHVPPANVDTIFVYSWALSALAGNPNVIRISSRAAGAALTILETLNECLAEAHAAIGQTQRMITYGHQDEVTAALSAACDLRVIWGGDRTVRDIRRHPLAPHARDVTFPDRSSYAAISLAGWQATDADGRKRAAEGLVNDVYWFDQAACSSPMAIFLVGDADQAPAVKEELLGLVAKGARAQGFAVDAAMAVEKRVSTYGLAAEGRAVALDLADNTVTGVTLVGPEAVPHDWLGAGVFPFTTVASLAEIAPQITRKDQTFSHFGFTREELLDFAHLLGGRGVDRIVPFGQALNFAGVWDGYDLIREFSRLVTVTA
ncbi:acyl-CoA reductase [Hamadaea sp. NPDC051192]|uniref:acyl-CoA reductase n=1 Tax=Hamadaea sp. NPDC051192 TaxID=3154940 RepID=UPI003441E849